MWNFLELLFPDGKIDERMWCELPIGRWSNAADSLPSR